MKSDEGSGALERILHASNRGTLKRKRSGSLSPRSASASLKQRKNQMRHIVDQLQVLVLRRPHLLDFVEDMLDGLLRGIHKDDRDNAASGAR